MSFSVRHAVADDFADIAIAALAAMSLPWGGACPDAGGFCCASGLYGPVRSERRLVAGQYQMNAPMLTALHQCGHGLPKTGLPSNSFDRGISKNILPGKKPETEVNSLPSHFEEGEVAVIRGIRHAVADANLPAVRPVGPGSFRFADIANCTAWLTGPKCC